VFLSIPLVEVVAVIAVLIAAFTIAVILSPGGVATAVARLPVVGPLATAECFRCDAPVLRPRAEEMPVVFGADGATNALTIKFCDECSRRMTLEDRLELLQGEAERRSNANE
jgi:hypothetical protein